MKSIIKTKIDEVLSAFKPLGISQLMDYQREILECPQFYPPNATHLLLSAPTGCGKNVVAEILATINTLLSGRKSIFILPYIATAQEVYFKLQDVWRRFGLTIKAHFGAVSVFPNDDFDGVVCTIEKSAALVNRLLRENKLDEYCCIVIDEIHMVLDQDRGALLEDLIIKLNYYKSTGREAPQIISMSATLENPEQICSFIGAQFVECTSRPNRIEEFAVLEKTFYKVGGNDKPVGRIQWTFNIASDVNSVIGLTMEALVQKKPVLIFCMTKACTEQTAHTLSKYIMFCNSKPHCRFPGLRQLGVSDGEETNASERLQPLLKTGIAYHHSGLSSDDRIAVEKLYREGKIKVIACTSTLSTGVNLPAARVLIRLDQGPLNINFITYNQMIGRCGRYGVGNGQAYIIMQNTQKLTTIWDLIKRRPFTRASREFTQLLLDALVLNMVTSEKECQRLLSATIQTPCASADQIVSYLLEHNFVRSQTTDEGMVLLSATQLGNAASQSFLRPADALFIVMELEKATKSLYLNTELHLTYLITPLRHKLGIDVSKIPWNKFFDLFDKLSPEYQQTASLVGITQATCVAALNGSPDDTLIRFYLALILMEALNNVPINQILQKYEFKSTDFEVLRDQAVLYARTVVGMCDCLAWPYVKQVLSLFTKKLELWAYPETCGLMKIHGMDGTRARSFIEHGITTIQELAFAEPATVERILKHAVPFDINSDNNGDRNEWLMNEELESCTKAAQLLIERSKQLVPAYGDVAIPNDTSTSVKGSSGSGSDSFDGASGIMKVDEDAISDSLSESSSDQCDQNNAMDVSMMNICNETAELSIIEAKEDQDKSIRYPSKAITCACKFFEGAKQLVFTFDNDEIVVTNGLYKTFSIPVNPGARCPGYCCSSGAMLQSLFVTTKIPRYGFNLSHILYKASRSLLQMEGGLKMKMKRPENLYCVASFFRARLGKFFESEYLLLREIRRRTFRYQNRIDPRRETEAFVVGLYTLIHQALLKPSPKIRPLNPMTWHFHNSVITSITMSYRGIAFDRKKCDSLLQVLDDKIRETNEAAWAISGSRFDAKSGRSACHVLNKLGLVTKSWKSVSIEELEKMSHAITPLIISIRKLNYASKVLQEICQNVREDGRVHGYYNCLNSFTGRIFIENPAIQFVPKEKYINGESCRAVFCASEGHTLLSFDYKQVELRMLAALSADTNLCQLLQDGKDPFDHIAPNWALSRDTKKKVFYAQLYGQGQKSLAQQLKCTMSEARKLASDLFKPFKGVKDWMEDVVATMKKGERLHSLWNLTFTLKAADYADVKQKSVHFIIQASVSEMIRKKLNEVDKLMRRRYSTPSSVNAGLVLQLHDEFILEVPEADVAQCKKVVKNAMEFSLGNIKFPVKITQGRCWDSLG